MTKKIILDISTAHTSDDFQTDEKKIVSKKKKEHFQDFLSRMNVFDGIFVFFSALHIPVNQNIEKKFT